MHMILTDRLTSTGGDSVDVEAGRSEYVNKWQALLVQYARLNNISWRWLWIRCASPLTASALLSNSSEIFRALRSQSLAQLDAEAGNRYWTIGDGMVFRKDGFISAGIRSRRSSSSSSGGGIFRAVISYRSAIFLSFVQQTVEVVIYAA